MSEHSEPEAPRWRVRWVHDGYVHLTHDMSRVSALAMAQTMRECGIRAIVVPAIEDRAEL